MLAVGIKDLRLEARNRDLIPSVLVFALMVIVIFNFAFEPGMENRQAFAPGILLVAFMFSGMLGLARSFAWEHEQQAIRGLLMAPVDRSILYLGKMISNVIFLSIIMAISLMILVVFFNLDIFHILPSLAVILGLTVLGFVAVGTLYAAMAANMKLREILLPILFFPICIPVIIAALNAMEMVMGGQELRQAVGWLRFLAAYDVIFLVVGILTFEFVISE